jgi:hypothetical protein
MRLSTTWPGTPQDMNAFLAATARYCACHRSSAGAVTRSCPAHALVLGDQLAINRLVFARHIAYRLRQEEWSSGPSLSGAEAA